MSLLILVLLRLTLRLCASLVSILPADPLLRLGLLGLGVETLCLLGGLPLLLALGIERLTLLRLPLSLRLSRLLLPAL